MGSWEKIWTPVDVATADDPYKAFAEYCQQIIGVPWATQKDLIVLRKRGKEFFGHYPHADWYTLCRVASWCRSRRRRLPRVFMVIDEFRNAWKAGVLPELDPANRQETNVEEAIAAALEIETRQDWRRRLIGARGIEARREAYREWQTSLVSR